MPSDAGKQTKADMQKTHSSCRATIAQISARTFPNEALLPAGLASNLTRRTGRCGLARPIAGARPWPDRTRNQSQKSQSRRSPRLKAVSVPSPSRSSRIMRASDSHVTGPALGAKLRSWQPLFHPSAILALRSRPVAPKQASTAPRTCAHLGLIPLTPSCYNPACARISSVIMCW